MARVTPHCTDPALLFLKAFSAFFSLAIAIHDHIPAFYAVFVLDGTTTIVMGVLALRAAHALAEDCTAPWWARWLLVDPIAIERAPLPNRPTQWQLVLGALRMWHRILFRSETVGTSNEVCSALPAHWSCGSRWGSWS